MSSSFISSNSVTEKSLFKAKAKSKQMSQKHSK